MSINLLEAVQQNLGYPALKKIDPNSESAATDRNAAEDNFSQAAIPAILAGLNKYAQSDDGAQEILRNTEPAGWMDRIFGNDKRETVQKILNFDGKSYQDKEDELDGIANEAVRVTRANLPENADIKQVKLFLNDQSHSVLSHLPASLHMGELLHDNTLDDNTNKMEGPISSLMQSIGSAFSSPVTGEEIKPD